LSAKPSWCISKPDLSATWNSCCKQTSLVKRANSPDCTAYSFTKCWVAGLSFGSSRCFFDSSTDSVSLVFHLRIFNGGRNFLNFDDNSYSFGKIKLRMAAPECIPLTLEPESGFYRHPVIVLDFQALYPSMCIAYNYCYSTCLGKVAKLGQ